jgi:hypothetical protein
MGFDSWKKEGRHFSCTFIMKGQFTIIDSLVKKKCLFAANITLFISVLLSDINTATYCDQSLHIKATQYHMKWKYLPDGDRMENSNNCLTSTNKI